MAYPTFEEWSQSMNFGRGEAADDARAAARVQYDQLVQSGAYGTNIMGVTPGSWSVIELDGKKWHRMGVDPSQITEGRFDLSGVDRAQHFMNHPEHGFLLADEVAQGLNKQAQRIAEQDKQGGFTNAIQGFFDKGGGVGLMAAGFMGPVAAQGGLGAGGLAGAEASAGGGAFGASGLTEGGVLASESGFVPGSFELGQGAGLDAVGTLGERASSMLANAGGTMSDAGGPLADAATNASSVGIPEPSSTLADPMTAPEIAEPYGAGESFGIRPPGLIINNLPTPGPSAEIAEPYGAGERFSVSPGAQQSPLGSAAQQFLNFFKSDMAKYGLIQAGGGMIAGAFRPTADDAVDARLRLDAEQRAAIQPNFNVGRVRLPTPNPQPLRRPDGSLVYGTNGLINRNIRR